jgi:hypothetical protein
MHSETQKTRIPAKQIADRLKSLRVPTSMIERHVRQLKKWRSTLVNGIQISNIKRK